MKQNKKFYVGAMTGTSHDAIDVSIIEIQKNIELKYFYSKKFSSKIRAKIKNVIDANSITLNELGQLNKEVGILFAKSINEAIIDSKIKKSNIACIAVSGQTIRHEPHGKPPFSMQIGDPNIIASLTDLVVISDFRNMHIALGGEGAPLVPEFHNELFFKPKSPRIIINIGGISNFSFVKARKEIYGTDIGPGNALMDAYCQKFLNKPFDKNGAIAAKGKVINSELKKLLANPFFKKAFPKSTGKELFNINLLSKKFLECSPEDILATLVELTAQTIVLAIDKNKYEYKEMIICGGGSKNKFLIERIKNLIPHNVMLSSELGHDPQSIESMAFAWMGYMRINNKELIVQQGKNKYTSGLLGTLSQAKL